MLLLPFNHPYTALSTGTASDNTRRAKGVYYRRRKKRYLEKVVLVNALHSIAFRAKAKVRRVLSPSRLTATTETQKYTKLRAKTWDEKQHLGFKTA